MSKESDFSPSRREFLKAVGAAAFLVGLGIPSDVAMRWEKKFGDKELLPYSFEEGMHILKDHVWEKKTESLRVFIEKEEKYGWIDIAANDSANSSDDEVYIDTKFLNSLFGHDVSKIYLAHSHPCEVYRSARLLPEATIKNIAAERESVYPILPTGADILRAVQIEEKLGEQTGDINRLRHYVIEPAGAWQYRADAKHPQMRKIFADFEEGRSMSAVTLTWMLEEWREKIIKGGGLNQKNLAEFTKWAEDEYGITFTHRPHY